MPVPQFHCPHCSQPLRIRHSSLVGQWFDCPECHEPIKVIAGQSGIQAIRSDGTSGEVAPTLEPSTVSADGEQSETVAPDAETLAGAPGVETVASRSAAASARIERGADNRVAEQPVAAQPSDSAVVKPEPTPGHPGRKATRRKRTGNRSQEDMTSAWQAVSARLRQWANPARLGWLVAGLAAVLVLFLGWGEDSPSASGPGSTVGEQAVSGEDSSADAAQQQPGPGDLDHRGAVVPPVDDHAAGAAIAADDVGDPDAAQPLVQISSQLRRYIETNRQFPPAVVDAEGVNISERLSWIADVVADAAPAGPQPLRDRSWQDPLNDRFVRRPLTAWQNPRVKTLTGPHGFPAAHFVGIAGVGEDGPQLPADHPRAGIFGYGRQTRLDQVHDGLTETMMIAGVTTDIGAWAGSGRGTIRPLTQAPYVNGPDGFGTGQPDGMYLLMADGSVKFRSVRTAPVIFRRMAAMNDGLPLDPEVPGEPGDKQNSEQPVPEKNPVIAAADPAAKPDPAADPGPVEQKPPVDPEQPGVAETDPQPAAVPVKPAADPIGPDPLTAEQIAAALRQPIVRFRTADVITLGGLLGDLEEMIGAPIVSSDAGTGADRPGAPPEVRDQAVSLDLRDTTLGAILKAAVDKAGLEFQVEAGQIRLQARGSDVPES